jgi:hypothetical protein
VRTANEAAAVLNNELLMANSLRTEDFLPWKTSGAGPTDIADPESNLIVRERGVAFALAEHQRTADVKVSANIGPADCATGPKSRGAAGRGGAVRPDWSTMRAVQIFRPRIR